MLYAILWPVSWLLFKIIFRLKIVREENPPARGPFIIVANHQSYLDPIVVALAFRRRIFFMAKTELFQIPLFNLLIRILGAFPVERGEPDREALRRALEILAQGKVLGMFPEGTRTRDKRLGPLEPGVAIIALRSNVPIVPVGVIGTEKVIPEGSKIPRLPKLKVVVGKPFILSQAEKTLPKRERVSRVNEIISAKILSLLQKNG